MSGEQTEILPVPGSDTPLVIARSPDGRLLRLSGGGQVYVEAPTPERVRYTGLATIDLVFLPAGFVRRVETAHGSWSERHAWDDIGRISHADGTAMEYDDEGRIVACRGPEI